MLSSPVLAPFSKPGGVCLVFQMCPRDPDVSSPLLSVQSLPSLCPSTPPKPPPPGEHKRRSSRPKPKVNFFPPLSQVQLLVQVKSAGVWLPPLPCSLSCHKSPSTLHFCMCKTNPILAPTVLEVLRKYLLNKCGMNEIPCICMESRSFHIYTSLALFLVRWFALKEFSNSQGR